MCDSNEPKKIAPRDNLWLFFGLAWNHRRREDIGFNFITRNIKIHSEMDIALPQKLLTLLHIVAYMPIAYIYCYMVRGLW